MHLQSIYLACLLCFNDVVGIVRRVNYDTLTSDYHMPPPSQQRTPLRRVSQGSLRALSRSSTFPDAPHGLGFLGPAMEELADETEALHTNVANLNMLSQSLATFNEAFASYLFVMEMNGLTTDWPQVCLKPKHRVHTLIW